MVVYYFSNSSFPSIAQYKLHLYYWVYSCCNSSQLQPGILSSRCAICEWNVQLPPYHLYYAIYYTMWSTLTEQLHQVFVLLPNHSQYCTLCFHLFLIFVKYLCHNRYLIAYILFVKMIISYYGLDIGIKLIND